MGVGGKTIFLFWYWGTTLEITVQFVTNMEVDKQILGILLLSNTKLFPLVVVGFLFLKVKPRFYNKHVRDRNHRF